MYAISELQPTGKNIAIGILIVFILLVVAGGIGYMLGIRNGGTAKGDGGDGGAGQVGQHIQSAVTAQREITERIDGLQNGVAEISGSIEKGAAGVDAAAAANNRAEVLVRESGELIAEGQRILQTIRSRAEKDQAAR